MGFEVIGFLSDKAAKSKVEGKSPAPGFLGSFDELERVMASNSVDEVVVSLEYDQYALLPDIIEACEKAGTKVSVIPFYTKHHPAKPYIDEIESLPVINIRKIPLNNLLNNWIKRLFDFFAALFLIILVSPLLLADAILVKLTHQARFCTSRNV